MSNGLYLKTGHDGSVMTATIQDQSLKETRNLPMKSMKAIWNH